MQMQDNDGNDNSKDAQADDEHEIHHYRYNHHALYCIMSQTSPYRCTIVIPVQKSVENTKIEKATPRKIITPENFILKLCTRA